MGKIWAKLTVLETVKETKAVNVQALKSSKKQFKLVRIGSSKERPEMDRLVEHIPRLEVPVLGFYRCYMLRLHVPAETIETPETYALFALVSKTLSSY